jgi:hypothetical protein
MVHSVVANDSKCGNTWTPQDWLHIAILHEDIPLATPDTLLLLFSFLFDAKKTTTEHDEKLRPRAPLFWNRLIMDDIVLLMFINRINVTFSEIHYD